MGEILDRTNSSNILVKDGLAEMERWKQALTDDQWNQAKMVVIDEHENDKLMCTLTPSGTFSVPEYVKEFRISGGKKIWSDWVWNTFTSFRTNAFMWKVFRGAIPVDTNIQSRGVPLVSMCICCSHPTAESLEHLLLHSDMARIVWEHFAIKLQKSIHFRSIDHLCRLWLYGSHRRSQLGRSILAIIFFGLWETWKTRCRMKYDEESFNANLLLRRVYTQVYDLNIIHDPKRMPSIFETVNLENIGIPVRTVQLRKGKWIGWMKPQAPVFKLNVDGSRKGIHSAGGGVVRDHRGDFVCSFSSPYDCADAMEAELAALLEGMRMCQAQELVNVCIEMDSALAVKMIDDSSQIQWRYVHIVRRIKERRHYFKSVKFIYREQNMVAVHLAKDALGASEKTDYFRIQDLPMRTQKLIFLDRIGLPNFRSPCN